MSDPVNAEQQALQHAVGEVGYLHAEFSVEIRSQGEYSATSPGADIIIVRNNLTRTERRYNRGRDQDWRGQFKRDLTAGAFN